MIKYAAYCRKSTDEKDKQVLSIESQLQELKIFAKREDLNVSDFIVESKSAKKPGRKEFGRLLQLIEVGKIDGILSWHPDRLARNSVDGGKLIYLLDTGKLKSLKFPCFWFENTPQGKFMLNIAFSQSKYYVDNLAENVKRGNRQKLRVGIWPNRAPLGYFNCRQSRTIKIDLKTKDIIRKAFILFSKENKKVSFTSIVNFLYLNGIRNKHGKPLHITRIKRMLTNRFYIGILDYNGQAYKGSQKLFISKKLFQMAQRKIRNKRDSKPRPRGRNHPYLGLIKCKECGASITAEQHTRHYKIKKGSRTYIYYRCTRKLGPCRQPFVSKQLLEKQIRKKILGVALPSPWAKKWLELLEQEKIAQIGKKRENIVKFKNLIDEVDKKRQRLIELYLNQGVSEEDYKLKKNKLFEDKLKIEAKIEGFKRKTVSWLEPFAAFIQQAEKMQKIARKENNSEELEEILQRVGSNTFLKDKKLEVEYENPYLLLRAAGFARSRNAPKCKNSLSVTPRRVELRLSG